MYLGLDPSRYPHPVVHYPIIRTVPIEKLDGETKKAWHTSTHMLFTSRTAVQYWIALAPFKGEILAIGAATAAILQQQGSQARIAPSATQEGVVELLQTLDLSTAHLLWPRSALARPVVETYLRCRGVSLHTVNLYETKTQTPGPLPHLDDFDEIVFTSPSTVDAFLTIFGPLPKNKRLTPIGPITGAALLLAGGSY